MQFIFSGIIFFCWAIFVIFLYYSQNASHINLLQSNNLGLLVGFLGIFGILFALYKKFMYQKNSSLTTWNFWTILWGFFAQLFLVCVMYSVFVSETFSSGNAFVLFWKILQILTYPFFLVFLWRAVGATILSQSTTWKNISKKFTIPAETTIGMFVFVMGMFTLGIFGAIKFVGLLGLLGILTIISFLGWKIIFSDIKNLKITFSSSPISFKIISAELAFSVLAFVISVAFINILRPMPIGWDDIGVYMNFPRLIAKSGELLSAAGMTTWHLVTASGFLIGDTTAVAFFVNQIGGILATITIISTLSLFLEKPNNEKKTDSRFLILPIILGVVYYLMPMTIFQQAKDMKLDPALMFVSVTAFSALILATKSFFEKENFKKTLFLIFLAGIFVGFAFSIKVTSLMLILASLGFLSYQILGFGGFIGFSGIFLAIFTKLGLWSQMFVQIPSDSIGIFIWGLIVGIFGYIFAFFSHQQNILKYTKIIVIFLIGIAIPVVPWVTKNFIHLSGHKISPYSLINGSREDRSLGIFFADFGKIYSTKELAEREADTSYAMITDDGTSLNEDFARYFGQETGINNYIKLPANLTLQKNQTGEFTDITYIFLAFFPVSLLLLHTKSEKKYKILWLGGIIFLLIFGLMSFGRAFGEIGIFATMTNILWTISLPVGYGILLIPIILMLLLAHFCLPKETITQKNILGLIFFLAFYGFLFWISAFGVVWYGILIYFLMLALIGFGIENINDSENDSYRIKQLYTLGFFVFIGLYIFGSAILHSYNNLTTAGYNEYKFGQLSQNSAIFFYKNDYFEPLLELNRKDSEDLGNEISKKFSSLPNVDFLKNWWPDNAEKTPKNLHEGFVRMNAELQFYEYQILALKNYADESITKIRENSQLSTQQKRSEIQNIQTQLDENLKKVRAIIEQLRAGIATMNPLMDTMYAKILSPEKTEENDAPIYRIGTFFTYFINNNRVRFYDDSLLISFQKYFYDENSNITIDRIEKMGFKYLLVDLNAATIDKKISNEMARKAGRKSLTDRYENLLKTVKNPKLELASTDNLCLRFAIDELKNGNITNDEDFLKIVGTNYTSYKADENGNLQAIAPTEKRSACIKAVYEHITKNGTKSYSYFLPTLKAKTQEEFNQIFTQLFPNQTWFALFKIIE